MAAAVLLLLNLLRGLSGLVTQTGTTTGAGSGAILSSSESDMSRHGCVSVDDNTLVSQQHGISVWLTVCRVFIVERLEGRLRGDRLFILTATRAAC